MCRDNGREVLRDRVSEERWLEGNALAHSGIVQGRDLQIEGLWHGFVSGAPFSMASEPSAWSFCDPIGAGSGRVDPRATVRAAFSRLVIWERRPALRTVGDLGAKREARESHSVGVPAVMSYWGSQLDSVVRGGVWGSRGAGWKSVL